MAKSTINPTVYNQLYKNQVNRGEQTREDDDYIKIPEITIYDVDYAILQYIRNNIKPEVQDRDRMIDVPVMYGSGELWSQIQSNGFMRDEKNKLLCPVITLSRTRMEEYKDFAKLDVNNRISSRVYYRQGYTQNSNRYGSNNRGNTDLPQKEIYITLIPEYYYVYYDLSIWTDFNEQLNKVVEMFIPVNNFVWGNDYQFVTNIEDFSFSTVNISKQERIVKASTRLRVLATLTPAFVERKSSIQKAFSVKKVSVAERVINDQNVVESEPSRTKVFKTISLQSNILSLSSLSSDINFVKPVSSNLSINSSLVSVISFVQKAQVNLSAFGSLSGDINFIQKLQSSLTSSNSLAANALVSKLASASLTGAGTTAANLTVTSSASFLLDLYPNAAAAYSLRKLRSAYTGSAIRVRASTSGAEGDVGFDVNSTISASSTVTVTAVGASGLSIGQQVTFSTFWNAGGSNQNVFVTTWYDQSGNAQNATQTTQASQPRIVNSGVVQLTNSKPSLYFDGVNDFLTGSALSNYITASTFSNISVFNPIVLTTNNTLLESNDALWIDSTNGYAGVFFKSTNNLFAGVYSNVLHQVSIPITANTQITSFAKLVSGNVSISKNNGTFANATASNITVLTNNLTIARSNVYAELNAQEIIFYKTDQTSNVNEMNTNINTYYAIY